MNETMTGPAAATGAAGSGVVPAPRPPLALGGRRSRALSERLIGLLLFLCAAISVLTTVGIILVLIFETVSFFGKVPFTEFAFGTTWNALSRSNPEYGVLPLVNATLLLSLLAMIVALPLGLMAAIYLSEYAPDWVRAVLKPILEILAGIPTIVYGYFALTFITPEVLERFLFPDIGIFNVLAASIAVGVMILPLIASLSEDALRAVPSSLREGAYGLGGTKFEVSTQVVVPAALSGIVASVILAISRAVGETMIVVLAMGNKPHLSWNPLESMQAMTAYIVQIVGGDVSRGSLTYESLFAVGMTLFVITFVLNVISHWVVTRFREVYQ